jgi:hypothetical protein
MVNKNDRTKKELTNTMKYICLGYMEPDKFETMSESERNALLDDIFNYDDVLRNHGHYIGEEPLQSAKTAPTVRWNNGQVSVTDGPYAETKEQLGGILVLEARDLNHAIQLLSAHPGVRAGLGPFEIRPAADADLSEMRRASEQRRAKAKGQPARPKTVTGKGEVKTQYLVAIHHPDDYDPSAEDEAIFRDIEALNLEMMAAGVRIFAGGLHPASSAKSLRAKPDGKVLITDGPYLETKEHVGGFWLLEAADLDEALAWGRKAAVACRAPVEVRPFLGPDGSK